VAIREWQQEILFFHKLASGSSSKSYGIQVARLAGLPEEITGRAREILAQLEGGQQTEVLSGPAPKSRQYFSKGVEPGVQLSMFQKSSDWIKDRIDALDLDTMTPMAALQTLHSIKEDIIGKQSVRSGTGRQKVSSYRKR